MNNNIVKLIDDGLEAMYKYDFDKAISIFEKILEEEPNWESAKEYLIEAKEYKAGKNRPPRLTQEVTMPLGRAMSMTRAKQFKEARQEIDLVLKAIKKLNLPKWDDLRELENEIDSEIKADELFDEAKKLARKGNLTAATEKAKKASELSLSRPLYKEFLRDLSRRTSIKIFISYAKEDINTAMDLYVKLKDEGFTIWLDEIKILPGENWRAVIQKEISNSDVFIACLSQHSVSKHGYVQAELKKALEILEEYPEGDIFVIPVRFDNCSIPNKLSHIHYIDYNSPNSFEKLIRAIVTKIKT